LLEKIDSKGLYKVTKILACLFIRIFISYSESIETQNFTLYQTNTKIIDSQSQIRTI